MSLIERLQDPDPALLVDAAQGLPLAAGIALVVVGLLFAAFGAHPKAIRATVGASAGVAGLFLGGLLDPALFFGLDPTILGWGAAAAMAILGVAWPLAAAFVCCGVAGSVLTRPYLPNSQSTLAALPGFVVGAALGAIFHRAAASLVSSFVGSVVATVGAVAIVKHTKYAAVLTDYPVAPLLPLALVFVTLAAFQLTRRKDKPSKGKKAKVAKPVQATGPAGGGATGGPNNW